MTVNYSVTKLNTNKSQLQITHKLCAIKEIYYARTEWHNYKTAGLSFSLITSNSKVMVAFRTKTLDPAGTVRWFVVKCSPYTDSNVLNKTNETFSQRFVLRGHIQYYRCLAELLQISNVC